jgi:hypothetical protein
MTDDALNQILNLSAEDVRLIASLVLGTDATPVGSLTVTKIGRSVGQATVGIYHATGQAGTSSGEKNWSAVVKVLGAPAFPIPGMEVDPRRELAAYASGALADFRTGIRAARCYAIQEQNNLQLLWLEDLSEAPQPPWIAKYFVQAARHLGQFNGHWPEGALPDWDWLHHGGIRTKYRTQRNYQSFERLNALQCHDIIGEALPPDVARGLAELWHDSEKLLTKVEAAPRGVCHSDCHQRNLFPMSGLPGEDFTVAIDWAAVGISSLGFDIGQLLASAVKSLDLSLNEAEKLVGPLFDAYMAGLAEAGWSGNEEQVRLTYLTCLGMGEAVRTTSILELASHYPDPRGLATFFGVPAEEFFSRWAEALRFFLVYNDKALELARRL